MAPPTEWPTTSTGVSSHVRRKMNEDARLVPAAKLPALAPHSNCHRPTGHQSTTNATTRKRCKPYPVLLTLTRTRTPLGGSSRNPRYASGALRGRAFSARSSRSCRSHQIPHGTGRTFGQRHATVYRNLNRVYEVLNRKRGLSLSMIRRLNRELKIPAEWLIG